MLCGSGGIFLSQSLVRRLSGAVCLIGRGSQCLPGTRSVVDLACVLFAWGMGLGSHKLFSFW